MLIADGRLFFISHGFDDFCNYFKKPRASPGSRGPLDIADARATGDDDGLDGGRA